MSEQRYDLVRAVACVVVVFVVVAVVVFVGNDYSISHVTRHVQRWLFP